MIALVMSTAWAQSPGDWSFQAGAVLSPIPGSTWMGTTLSNPSVVRDWVNNQYVMAFETRTDTVHGSCPNGVWAVGLATSPDGITWTPQPNPVVMPNPGSGNFMACVAAHPTLVFRTTTAAQVPSMYLYFKAEGLNGTPGGIGAALLKFSGARPYLRTLYATPALAAGGRSYSTPHAVRQGSRWRLMVQDYPDILEFTSTTPTSFTGGGSVVLDHSALRAPVVPWVDNELFNPAYVCGDDPVGNMDLKLFVGGRDTDYGAVVDGAFGTAISNRTTIAFALDATPQVTWTGNSAWRHWDVVGLTTGEYLVYFDEKDGSGNNFIRLGGTDLGWSAADVGTRYCP